jgi:hypothetical protein
MNVRLILSVVVTGFLMVTAGAFEPGFPAATSHAAEDGAEVARLKAEIEQLKGRLPSQSHAIIDVGYHFSNLWFAGQQQNWALAEFYLNETRSHLRWAVRIVPVRRTKAGEVDLRGLLESVDQGGLTEIGKAIADKHVERFAGAYRQTLEGCYACHAASDKPYLRPRIPDRPETTIINFDPAASRP